MSTTQYMNVILVGAKGFHFNGISFFDAARRFLDNLGHICIQQRFTVLHWKNNMVMNLPRTMRTLLYPILSLRLHSLGGYQRKRTP